MTKWTLMDEIEKFTDAKAICDLVNIIVDSDEYFEVDDGRVISNDRLIMIAPKSDYDINDLESGGEKWLFSIHLLKKIIALSSDYDDKIIFPDKAVPMKIQCSNYDIYIAPRVEEVDEE